MANMFLMIDGYEIPDAQRGDYTAYETELGVSARMINGRRVEELRAKIWTVEVNLESIDADQITEINQAMAGKREHFLVFLPPTGGSELISSRFHLADIPSPKLDWWNDGESPVWQGYKMVFEEVEGHD